MKRPWTLCWFVIGLVTAGVPWLAAAQSAQQGETIFQQQCVACHTLGEGKKIGPDLKGVTERREPEWLKGFIQTPSAYLAQGDETAAGLLKEYGIPMPDLGLTEAEVDAVIAYLAGSQLEFQGTTAIPPWYIPTLAVGVITIIVLTLSGLIAGHKKWRSVHEKQVV